jgi:hypothetical protein
VVCVHPSISCTVTYHRVSFLLFFFLTSETPLCPFFIPPVQVSATAAHPHIHAFTPFMCITYIQPPITYHFVETGQIEQSPHFKTVPTSVRQTGNPAGSYLSYCRDGKRLGLPRLRYHFQLRLRAYRVPINELPAVGYRAATKTVAL